MMTTRISRPNRSTSRRQGLSLAEVAFSTLLVGVVLIGATDLLSSVISGRTDTSDRAVAQHLAQQLMTEILSAHYEDPNSPVFGVEADEAGSDRSKFDDVDDYHGWSESEAVRMDGLQVLNVSGWSREVTVEWVDYSDISTASGAETELKQIMVDVLRNGVLMSRLISLRSNVSH